MRGGRRRVGLAAVLALPVFLALPACAGGGPVKAPASGSSVRRTTSPVAATSATTTPAMTPDGRSTSAAATGDPKEWSRLPVPSGRLLVTHLDGPTSGVRMKVWVWLPPQYDDSANAGTAFPALMLYPGGSGAGYNTWAGPLYGAQQLVASGAGGVTPFVFVMPAMQLSERLDTECADLPGQPKVGSFLAVDVRRLVEATFRVLHTRDGWGAAGASSGGYCAMRLVLNHPDAYAAGVSIDGYFDIQTTLPGGQDPAVRAQDPSALAASAPDLRLLLWSGGSAGVDLKRAQTFAALIHPPTTVRLDTLPGGKHLTSDFARMMPGTLRFLTEALARPTPPPKDR